MRVLLIFSFLYLNFTSFVYCSSLQEHENFNQIQLIKNGKVKSKLKINRKIIFTAATDEIYKNRKGRLVDVNADSLYINLGNKENIKIQAFHINEISMIGYPTPLTNVFSGVIYLISPINIIYPFYRKFKTDKGWEIRIAKKTS